MGQVRFLRFVEIAQKSAQRHGGGRLSGRQLGKGFLAKLSTDVFLRLRQPEPAFAAVFKAAVEFVSEDVCQRLLTESPVAENGLGGAEPAQLIDDVGHSVPAGKGGEVRFTGGQVAECYAAPLTVQINTAEVVAGLVIQTCGVNDGAGGHHPDNIPLHQPLGGGGVLHLLADGHLVALGDETGNIGLAGVIGDAAHGDPFFLRLGVFAVVPGGQGQVQFLGSQLGIVGEHLIEVPQTEKQNGIRVVLLDFQILLHHGGKLRHKNTSFYQRVEKVFSPR